MAFGISNERNISNPKLMSDKYCTTHIQFDIEKNLSSIHVGVDNIPLSILITLMYHKNNCHIYGKKVITEMTGL